MRDLTKERNTIEYLKASAENGYKYAVVCILHYREYTETKVAYNFGTPYLTTTTISKETIRDVRDVFNTLEQANNYANSFPITNNNKICYKYSNPEVIEIEKLLSHL